MEKIDFEQEIQTRNDNIDQLEKERHQAIDNHNSNLGRLRDATYKNQEFEINQHETDFKFQISKFNLQNQLSVTATSGSRGKSRKFHKGVLTRSIDETISYVIGKDPFRYGELRTLERKFEKKEMNKALEKLLLELSTDCSERKLEAGFDLFESDTYNKNEKYQMMNHDSFIYVPSKGDTACLIEVKTEIIPGRATPYNRLDNTQFSRFILPEKALVKISDFRLGRIDNSLCCRNAGENVKISTLEKRNFWSVLHFVKDHQSLKDEMGFLMNSLKVADLNTCAEVARDEEGWDEKGMMSYLGAAKMIPVFFGIQQWTDKEGKKQIFAVPVKERRRTKAGMKTTYYSELSSNEIETFEKAFKRLQLEVIPTWAYSNKVMDVLGE